MNNNKCSSCNVEVSADLRYCPLCGKYVAKNKDESLQETSVSFPKVNKNFTVVERWLKIVKAFLVLAGIVSVATNLFFTTKPYWFPYVVVGLFALWRILFYPFKEGKDHIGTIPMSGIIVAVLLIFIDVYDYYFHGTALGWALSYGTPAVFTGTTLVAFILALTNRNFEEVLTKGIVKITIVDILFLISKLIWFNQFKNWAIFMSLLASFVALFLLFLFKRKRLVKEINRNFHI